MDMAKTKLAQLGEHGELLHRYGASVRILGRRSLIKDDVLEGIDRAVELTKGNKDAILNVCFPYTSQDEMTTAIRETVDEYSTPVPASQNPRSQHRRSFSETHIVHNIQNRRLSTSSAISPEGSLANSLNVPSSNSPSSSAAASDTEDSVSSSTTLFPDSPFSEDTQNLKPDSAAGGDPSSSPPVYGIQQPTETYPDPETITEDVLNEHMFTAELPPLDLLIRTSGVERLSDFMLWQCHQDTEIVFLKCLWPEFDLWNFLPVLVEWQWKRRKGVLGAAGSTGASGEAKGPKIKVG